MAKQKKVLIVIPCYNEEATIEEVVTGAVAFADVMVVDDASKDKTPEKIQKLQKKFPKKFFTIRHEKNTHIPGGIKDGMSFALKNNYDFVLTMDAGLSHRIEDLPLFLNETEYDLVIGSRATKVNVPFFRKVISFLASVLMNYAIAKKGLGLGIKDCTSGYRMYSKRIYSKIVSTNLESKAFDFHMEALAIAISNDASFKEVPITYIFSNSSFNSKVLKLALSFAWKLIQRKWA